MIISKTFISDASCLQSLFSFTHSPGPSSMHNHLKLMNEWEKERHFHDRAEIDTLAKTIESKVEHCCCENETVNANGDLDSQESYKLDAENFPG